MIKTLLLYGETCYILIWKTYYGKNVIISKYICRYSAIPIKILQNFMEIDGLILKVMRIKRTKNSKGSFEEEKWKVT